ncbi:MAG TPA: VOC family protein [Vicinamibacteria bacterium]|nr:VOC family protein [Vicinamibacteria bacterium]
MSDGAAAQLGPGRVLFTCCRVDNLGELLEQLRAGGVEVLQGPESHENGMFAWIMDPDENKIERWEPKVWDDRNKGA